MAHKLISDLKEFYYNLKDDKGNWRDIPVGVIYSSKLDKDGINIIKEILDIIMDSDNISSETKIFITNRGVNVKDTNEIINDIREKASDSMKNRLKPLSYSNTTLKINNDDSELVTILGERFFRDLLYDIKPSDKELRKKMNELVKVYGVYDKSKSNLGLNIVSNNIDKNDYHNNEDFFDILQSIEPYLVQRKRLVEQAINSNVEFVEYFNYLLSSKGLTDKSVRKDRERLLKFLNNEDYMLEEMQEHVESLEVKIEEEIIKENSVDTPKENNVSEIDLGDIID